MTHVLTFEDELATLMGQKQTIKAPSTKGRVKGISPHENIETGRRNALDCPRCKGTGKEPYKAGETP